MLLILLASAALAFEHSGYAWTPSDMPISYWVDDAGTVDTCEETVPLGYCFTAMTDAFTAWEGAECAAFDHAYAGVGVATGFLRDDLNTVSFNDPSDELPSGVLAATLVLSSNVAFVVDGRVYGHAYESDIVFNDNIEFVTHDEVMEGECDGDAYDLDAVATHEVGHVLGMAHPCSFEGGCDEVESAASMYFDIEPCDGGAATLGEDDSAGLTALYGPRLDVACSNEVSDAASVGVVPFTVQCVLEADPSVNIDSVSWNFGDLSEHGTGVDVSHTYEQEGIYDLKVSVQGSADGCDRFEAEVAKSGYVRVCDVPEPVFELEHVFGITWNVRNQTGVGVYGCHSDIVWEVYEGTKVKGKPALSFEQWEPQIVFPDEGTWTVIVNLGGIAGTGAASVTLDVKRESGLHPFGCASVAGVSASWCLLLPVLFARRRRSA